MKPTMSCSSSDQIPVCHDPQSCFFLPNHSNVSADHFLEWSLSVDRPTGWELLTLTKLPSMLISLPVILVIQQVLPGRAWKCHLAHFSSLSTCCTERLELRGSLAKASETCGTEFSVNHVLRLGKYRINEQLTLKALQVL